MNNSRNVTNRMIINIAAASFILLILLWFVVGNLQTKNNEYEYSLEDHWTVYKNGQLIEEDKPIEDINFGNTQPGDVIEFYVDLPDELQGGYSVQVLFYLCSVSAYVGDEQIYSFAEDLIGKDVMVGSGYHFIPLPDDISGKQLYIKTVMNEPNAFTSISTPKCAKTLNARVAFASSQTINSIIGIFLLALGVVLAGVSLVAMLYDKVYRRLLFIGLFSFFMGMWTLISNKVFQIFSTDYLTYSELEYFALYWAPVPFGCLLYDIQGEKRGWRRILSTVTLFTDGIFALVVTLLHYTNVVRYPRVLTVYHVVAITSVITIAIACFFSVKEKNRSEYIVAIAIVMITIILGLDVGRFNLQKYILPNYELLMNSFIPLGTLVFVIMLIVSYLMYMYDMVMTMTEKETLTKLAYHDVLTGLYNRARYEETMNELDGQKENFSIISIDLNDLKYVNDTFGHNKGDQMLTTFARILSEAFRNVGDCFRTGGDEYLVIVRQDKQGQIAGAIELMENRELEASANLIFEIHASYGVAERNEVEDGQAFKVFRLADRRMYEMKSKSKGKTYTFGLDKK